MRPLGDAIVAVMGRHGRQLAEPPACSSCKDEGGWGVRFTPDTQGGAEPTSMQVYCIACPAGQLTAVLHQATATRLRREKIEAQLARVGRQLPPGMATYSLSSYVAMGGSADLAKQVVTWLNTEPRASYEGEEPWLPWLFIGGNPGTGKTGLVVPVLLNHARNGGVGAFLNVPDWLDSIRETYGERGRPGPDEVNPAYVYQDIDLLIVDDITVARSTDWAIEQLYMLLNHRATHRRRTIITSNLTLDGLKDKLAQDDRGRRIPSRILEMCWGGEWVVKLTGRDLRNRG